MPDSGSHTPPRRRYPPFYERAVPIALAAIVALIVILLAVAIALALGLVHGRAQ